MDSLDPACQPASRRLVASSFSVANIYLMWYKNYLVPCSETLTRLFAANTPPQLRRSNGKQRQTNFRDYERSLSRHLGFQQGIITFIGAICLHLSVSFTNKQRR